MKGILDNRRNIAIFASGRGSNAAAIIRHFESSDLVNVALIVTNKKNAGVIDVAKNADLPAIVLSRNEAGDSVILSKLVHQYSLDLIALAGYLQLIPESFIASFDGKIVNIHPSLLPKYGGKGMYGMKVHSSVIRNCEPESGITIHEVNERYDEGEIILQEKLVVKPEWNEEKLAEEIHKLEHFHYPKCIENLCLNLK